MNKVTRFTGALLMGAHVVCGQDAAPKEPVKEVKEEAVKAADFNSVMREYSDLYNESMQKYRAAKTQEERNAAIDARPSADAYAEKILAMVKADPKAEGAADALQWVAMRTGQKHREAAVDLLIKDHQESRAIRRYIYNLSRGYGDSMERLKSIIGRLTDKGLKREAEYHLASAKLKSLDGVTDPAKASALREEIKADFQALAKAEKADPVSPKMLGFIENKLFQLENLVIGATAPDIVGKDQDEQEFKLSDYRGKVVLVDFWGYW